MNDQPVTILIAARDEEDRIGDTIAELRTAFPGTLIVVADDGSRDRTAEIADRSGARVVSLARRGKGQALTLAEHSCPEGALLLCDADLRGDLAPLIGEGDLRVAAFAVRRGGGFGLAKRLARTLIRVRGGETVREPLSGQRFLSSEARRVCFPVAAGFGVETRMTIDALQAGLDVREVELDLAHRHTGRDLAGFAHRGRQLRDLVLACGPTAVNHRGLRLPLTGWLVGVAQPEVLPVALVGVVDDVWSGPERGLRSHLARGTTTGVLKLVAIPLWALVRTRSVSGALLVALCANALNQLDTRPGRALKVFAAGTLLLGRRRRGAAIAAVLLAPYDLREMTMLGDGGSNALGAVLGLDSVERFTGRSRTLAILAVAGLTATGERMSLGAWIERTPVLRDLDRIGRQP